jgi:hypothetical protein
MSDTLRLIPADDPEWAVWIDETPHDLFHTAAHHQVWQEAGAGDGWLAVYGSPGRFVAWPYLLRTIDTAPAPHECWYDITAVDGYAGPLCCGALPGDPFVAAAMERIVQHWRCSRVVSVFARFHPLLINQSLIDSMAPGPTGENPYRAGLRHEGHTVSMDLRLSDQEAQRAYRGSHLRQIRRALRMGLTTEVDQSPTALREFVRLYHQTMRRNGANSHYFFSEHFLRRLQQTAAPNVSLHVARLHDRVAASVFITEYDGIVHYLLGGVADDMYQLSPLKPLLDRVREWARERGNHTLHLGGGRSCDDDDPLFYFKSGFSKRRHSYYTGRWILDPVGYDWLTQAHFTGQQERRESTDHFPAYRTPFEDRTAAPVHPEQSGRCQPMRCGTE